MQTRSQVTWRDRAAAPMEVDREGGGLRMRGLCDSGQLASAASRVLDPVAFGTLGLQHFLSRLIQKCSLPHEGWAGRAVREWTRALRSPCQFFLRTAKKRNSWRTGCSGQALAAGGCTCPCLTGCSPRPGPTLTSHPPEYRPGCTCSRISVPVLGPDHQAVGLVNRVVLQAATPLVWFSGLSPTKDPDGCLVSTCYGTQPQGVSVQVHCH